MGISMAVADRIWAVVPAGGTGSRMAQAIPKQYLEIAGTPIIEYTLRTLLRHKDLQRITVCVSTDDKHWPTLAIAGDPKITTAPGGPTRAESVLSGLKSLSPVAKDDDWVLVHDAARPCLKVDLLNNLVESLQGDKVGGILALQASDTLKQAHEDGSQTIAMTLNRSHVWMAQTPQMFRYRVMVDCLEQALQQGVPITDEASALEWAGYQPRLIQGDARNIKITTPEDLELAEFLLKTGDNS